MARFVLSLHTQGRVSVDVAELTRIFGSDPHDDVPISANHAEVVFEPGEVVKVVWTCIARPNIVEKLAPQLLAQDQAAVKDRGVFKRFAKSPTG